MNQRRTQCDESQLVVLLTENEQSDAFRRSAAHLETCQSCRSRLTTLAADHQTWDDVSLLLREYDEPPGGVSSSGQRNIDLDFLAPPGHPEMLGRLGRYEIESIVGAGGMGVVLKGRDTELNRPVAIKVLASHLANSGAARQRFAREGRAAAAVVHEHVVAIHNVETDAKTPFLVMQYVQGQSLQTRVDQQGPLEVKEMLRIGAQAAAGLSAAHAQGVVHRDIKPANILLENDVERVLLTDFGLARAVDDASLTRTGIIAGTPHYMSPEQASGEPIDQRSDLFSLGVVLYFMASGHPPFRADQAMAVLNRICRENHRPLWQVNPDIPDELSEVIDRLLEKKPSHRFANAEQVEIALRKILANLQQPGRFRRRWKVSRLLRRRRKPFIAGSLAAGAVAAALGLGAVLDFGLSRPETPNPAASASGSENSEAQRLADFLGAGLNSANEFPAEIVAIDGDLRSLEFFHTSDGGYYLQAASDGWLDEAAAIENEISELEKSFIDHPQSQGEKK